MSTDPPRPRADWEPLHHDGICPECRVRDHVGHPDCRKKWFDYGFSVGYHDGANDLPRHDDAFVVQMIDDGKYE